MKKIYNIYEAKSQLSKLVDLASRGNMFVIAKAGVPMAQLVPIEVPKKKEFPFGAMKGKIEIAPDFDDPLPQEILDSFEGGEE